MDSVKFSGGIVAGLSLLSTRIVRLTLVNEDDLQEYRTSDVFKSHPHQKVELTSLPPVIEFVAPPRSLYILSGECRYIYEHSILTSNKTDLFTDLDFEVSRRMSLITRDEKIL